jgi:alanine dehydrogenase
MKIGIPKEIKDKENRVSVTPEAVQAIIQAGHTVVVEKNAGMGSGFSNEAYTQVGAILNNVEEAWAVDMVVKVKEPMAAEYQFLTGQIVFTFFHLAGVSEQLTHTLLTTKTTAIAYETLEDKQGRLPILAPMSAVAGNMATLMGSYYLAKFNQGRGMQLGTVLGKQYGKVVIIGDGVVGQHAAHVASSMGAKVYLAGLHEIRGQQLIESVLPKVEFFLSNQENINAHIKDVDLIVGAVLSRGAKADSVITEAMIKHIPDGAVVVDVSIDQGGCIETSRPTSHSDPVFIKHGVIHYCVTNMPGAYPRTSTMALVQASLPYLLKLANAGLGSLKTDAGMAKAVNTFGGYITCLPAAKDLGIEEKFRPLNELL